MAEVVRSYGHNHYHREEKINVITLYPFFEWFVYIEHESIVRLGIRRHGSIIFFVAKLRTKKQFARLYKHAKKD